MQTTLVSLLTGRSDNIEASFVGRPSECALETIAGGPCQGSEPVDARAFVQENLRTDQGGFLAATPDSNRGFYSQCDP